MRDLREPISGYSHFFAMVLSAAGTALLVTLAAIRDSAWHVVSFAVFGASLILLYGASTLYHLLRWPEARKQVFRRIDHMMIFVLIAGTYTPVCLTALRGPWGWSLLGVVWGLAAVGLGLKLAWFQAPRWFSTLLYVVMGWVALIAFVPLLDALSAPAVGWLILGGLSYTMGAVFYATKWPTLHPRHFTFHELFHILVIFGSLSHFWFMYRYLLNVG